MLPAIVMSSMGHLAKVECRLTSLTAPAVAAHDVTAVAVQQEHHRASCTSRAMPFVLMAPKLGLWCCPECCGWVSCAPATQPMCQPSLTSWQLRAAVKVWG